MEKEAKCCRRGGRRSIADAEKSKRRRCGEIEGYGGNNFRNHCEWFVPASVANCSLGLCSDLRRAQLATVANRCESFLLATVQVGYR